MSDSTSRQHERDNVEEISVGETRGRVGRGRDRERLNTLGRARERDLESNEVGRCTEGCGEG